MSDDISLLKSGIAELGLSLNDDCLFKLISYKNLLKKWNKTFSLTAITNDRDIIIYHILDAISVVGNFENQQNILDVGSGMGIPAVILAVIFPESNIVALDSNSKKTSFLLQVKIELGLKNLTVVNNRVESYSFTDGFDVITSRAFANMNLFIELTHHLLKNNGIYLAMKGEKGIEEVSMLNSWISENIVINVPYLSAQRFLMKLRRKHEE